MWLYENDYDNKVRYILGIEGTRPLFCVGINPSTAEPGSLDRTLQSVQRHAYSAGFDSWIMFNVYPQRATFPDDLHLEIDPILHEKNMKWIEDYLGRYETPTIWAAWGTLIEKRAYLRNCLSDMVKIANGRNAQWVQFGAPSKKGHPHHPLYLRNDVLPSPFTPLTNCIDV